MDFLIEICLDFLIVGSIWIFYLESRLQNITFLIGIFIDFPTRIHDFSGEGGRGKSSQIPIRFKKILYASSKYNISLCDWHPQIKCLNLTIKKLFNRKWKRVYNKKKDLINEINYIYQIRIKIEIEFQWNHNCWSK